MDIFISYSHKDKEWKDRIVTFMQCMKQQNQFDYTTWDDGEIHLGDEWGNIIQSMIEKSKIAIQVISPDFLSSKFINETELDWLLNQRELGELAIVPLIVRPCPWEVVDWLAKIQLHPADGKALSSGKEYEIEESLIQLSLEVNRLLDQAKTEGDVEGESEEESMAAEEATQATLSSKKVVSESGHEFSTPAELKEYVADQVGKPVIDLLLIFSTKNQHTWLVATPGQLHCILDSENTWTADRMLQWSMSTSGAINVKARERSKYKNSGLVDIGRRQNWLYSLRLFSSPDDLVGQIEALLQKAQHS